MSNCIFCRIIKAELPAHRLYEDAEIIAIRDVNPQALVHFLLISKEHIPSLSDCETRHINMLGKMLTLANSLAQQEGSTEGFRTIINAGYIGRQEVPHLHIHVLGGTKPLPPMMLRE